MLDQKNNNDAMTWIQEHQAQISQQSEYGTHILFPYRNQTSFAKSYTITQISLLNLIDIITNIFI